MGKRKWWELPSPDYTDGDVIDGPEVVEQDDDGDWIDEFRFDDYRADRGLSSADAIWNRYGGGSSSFSAWESRKREWHGGMGKAFGGVDFATAKKIEAAQKLVQGFVDTFALADPLRARFDTSVDRVGGDPNEKSVAISHRPLLDKTIAEQDAHRIMTAQAANAAARVRYGGSETVKRRGEVEAYSYPIGSGGAIARELGEILDGYRIDSSFRRDYPGYDDVYAPAQAYVAKGLLGDRESFDLEDFNGASIANAALNYSDFTNWSGRESEREWWSKWAETYAHGSVEHFVKGVAEGVKHLNETLPPKPETPPDEPKGEEPPTDGPEGPTGKGKGKGKGTGKGSGQPDEQDETPDDDEQPATDSPSGGGDDANDDDEQDETNPAGGSDPDDDLDDDEDWGDEPKSGNGATPKVDLPTRLGEGVSLTGLANGQSTDVDSADAEKMAQTAGALAIGRDEKEIGEVYWSANGFRTGERGIKPKAESSANGYIKRAFTRSRTAHYASERGHVTGRIDNRSLPRIASDDYRLFAKRVAPSETRYRVWLLLDNSGSMAGNPQKQVANLAASVALAVRSVPNVTLDVWAWSSGQRVAGASFSAVRVLADGENVSNISSIGRLSMGGTPDMSVLSWAAREIRKQCRPDETPVILMASDGQGGLASEAMMRDPEIHETWRASGVSEEQIREYASQSGKDRVAEARKSGVKVLSVAIGSLDPASQDRIYGKGNHLIWKGSIKAMAKPLGDLLAKVASNRIK